MRRTKAMTTEAALSLGPGIGSFSSAVTHDCGGRGVPESDGSRPILNLSKERPRWRVVGFVALTVLSITPEQAHAQISDGIVKVGVLTAGEPFMLLLYEAGGPCQVATRSLPLDLKSVTANQ